MVPEHKEGGINLALTKNIGRKQSFSQKCKEKYTIMMIILASFEQKKKKKKMHLK